MKKNLKKILNKLSEKDVKFDSFDQGIADLKEKLREDIQIATIDEVKDTLRRFREEIDIEPILVAADELKTNLSENRKSLSDELNSRITELLEVIKENAWDETKHQKLLTDIDFLNSEIVELKSRKEADFAPLIKTTENTLSSKIESGDKILGKEIKEVKEDVVKLDDKLESSKVDLMSRISNVGGGSMNRQIKVSGVDVLTRYTDINLTGSVTATQDNTNKRVNIAFSGGGTSLTVKEADGDPTVDDVDTIVVTNGTLTDDGGGQITIDTGGGGSQTPWTENINADGFTLYGNDGANEDLTLEGTSHATKTTSYVILQPTAGFVGINTTSPTVALDVKGKGIFFDSTATTGATTLTVKAGEGQGSTDYFAVLRNDGTDAFRVGAFGRMFVNTDQLTSAQAFTWTNTGNLGFNSTGIITFTGISSATPMMAVLASAIRFGLTGDSTANQTFNISNPAAAAVAMSIKGFTSQSANLTEWLDVSGTVLSVVTAAGNFGIGTNTASAKLHTLSTTEQFRIGYDATNYIKFTVDSANSTNITPGTNANTGFNFTKADGTSVLNVSTNQQRVGINIAGSPSTALDVNGIINTNSTVTISGQNIFGVSSDFLVLASGQDRGIQSKWITAGEIDQVKIATLFALAKATTEVTAKFWGATSQTADIFRVSPYGGATDYLVVASSGNVGIGTSAPDKQLEINSATGACLRLTYNDANGSAATYCDTSVSSAGVITFDAVGSAPAFVFADKVTATAQVIFDGTTTSSGAGAVGITGSIHEITTTGTGDALTLANGAEGQRLTIVYVAEGAGTDTAVLTPTSFGSGTTVTFTVIGQTARLIFTNGKWYADGAPFGAAIA